MAKRPLKWMGWGWGFNSGAKGLMTVLSCPLSKVEKPISEVRAYCVLRYFCAFLTLWKMEFTLQEAQLGGRDYVKELDVYRTGG